MGISILIRHFFFLGIYTISLSLMVLMLVVSCNVVLSAFFHLRFYLVVALGYATRLFGGFTFCLLITIPETQTEGFDRLKPNLTTSETAFENGAIP